MFWASGLAATHGTPRTPAHNDWTKFHFGILCPKQRRDLASIPMDNRICGDPCAFTKTGLKLADGSQVTSDVVIFATGCTSGIDQLQLSKDGHPSFKLSPETSLLDHFIVPSFPVLANATALWTTFGPIRAVNAADMAVYHLCVRRRMSETEMERSSWWQLASTDSVSGLLFQSKTSAIKNFLKIHLDLVIGGKVNVLDFLLHAVQIFCLGKQEALKVRLPKLTQ